MTIDLEHEREHHSLLALLLAYLAYRLAPQPHFGAGGRCVVW